MLEIKRTSYSLKVTGRPLITSKTLQKHVSK